MTGLNIKELKTELGAVSQAMLAQAQSRDFDPAKHAELKAQATKLDAQIRAFEDAEALNAAQAQPHHSSPQVPQVRAVGPVDPYLAKVRSDMGFDYNPAQNFGSFGELLQSVARHYMDRDPSNTDPRLKALRASRDMDDLMTRAPSGMGEVDPTGGGFLVQSDFASYVWTRAYDTGKVLSRVEKLPISTAANSIKIPGVDETSRATGSRYGGVQSFWMAEGDPITGSKPKFRQIELDLKKLGSAMFVTDELLADTSLLTKIANTAFTEELIFMVEDAIIEGDGVGKPLGILKAPATVVVAKQNGQASGSLVKENIDAMYSVLWSRSRENAVWLINQLLWPQLLQLSQVVGTGGAPVFLPAGTMSGKPYATLYGIPVVEVEYCSAPGTPGDIILTDLTQYALADKSGIQAASSMHVRFLYDEMTFRFTYRVDGKPFWSKPLTPFKGSQNLSAFVVLAQR